MFSTPETFATEPPLMFWVAQVTSAVPVTVRQFVVPARTSAENALAVVIVNPPPAAAEAAAIAAVVIVASAVATPVPLPTPVA